jgi:hypothetical protein
MTFKHPTNGHVEEVSVPGPSVLQLGFFYFAVKGVWTHAMVGFLSACCTLDLFRLVCPVLAAGILRRHYLEARLGRGHMSRNRAARWRALLTLVLVTSVLPGCKSETKTDHAAPAVGTGPLAKKGETKADHAAPAVGTGPLAKKGEPVTVDGATWTVMAAGVPHLEGARTFGHVIAVTFRVVNEKKRESYGAVAPTVVDATGREFKSWPDQSDWLSDDARTIDHEHIPPGVPHEYIALYEVAPDSNGLRLRVRSIDERFGSYRDIDLEPIRVMPTSPTASAAPAKVPSITCVHDPESEDMCQNYSGTHGYECTGTGNRRVKVLLP